MSMDNFLSYLQQLLTMLDPENPYALALAEAALDATTGLAMASGKADPITIRTMENAKQTFLYLVSHQKEFAGVPGEYKANEQRRRKLGSLLRPEC